MFVKIYPSKQQAYKIKSTKMKNRIPFLSFAIFLFVLSACDISNEIYLEKMQESINTTDPTTRSFALSLASRDEGSFNIDQVCNVYSYIYKNWKYVNDPRGTEYFAKASESIENNFTGDCDDFAILMAASIESIGGRTRINLVKAENGKGHAFTEVYLDGDPNTIRESIDNHYKNFLQSFFGISKVKEIYYTPDQNNGIWLNLDWKSKFPGGSYDSYAERTIFYPREGYYEE